MVRKDNDDIRDVKDLKGKTVASVLGSNHTQNLKNQDPNGEIDIRTYETQEGTLNDVANGRIDAYVNSRTTLTTQIEKSGLPLKLVGEPFVYQPIAYPFAKDEAHDTIREEFNQEIEKLHQDGTLKKLSDKYFGEDITTEKK